MSASFADVVRRGRERAGLSQARVAALIGKSASTVRSWEQGRSNPGDPQSVSTLAAVLGLDEGELMGRAGFETPVPASVRKSAREELSTLAAERTEMIAVAQPNVAQPDQRPRHLHDGEVKVEKQAPADIPADSQVTRSPRVTTVQSVPIPTSAPNTISYIEDAEQRDFYRRRAVTTSMVMVFLVIVFLWAMRRTGGAFAEFVESFIDALNF